MGRVPETHRRYKSGGRVFAGVLALMIGVLTAPSAWSGGVYLNEFATPSMGVAGAGAEAWADGPATSFAFHNPAGMTRLKGHSVSLGAGLIVGEAEFDQDPATPFPGGDGGDQAGLAPLLGSHGVFSVTDDLKFGMSLFSVSGAALDPDDDWTGRYEIQEIELLTLSFNPTVAYRATDRLSVAGGVIAMYTDIDYQLAAPAGGAGRVEIDGDDWAFGFNLGVLFELSPKTRFGVIYVSKLEPEFSGDVKTNLGGGFSVPSTLEFTFPQVVRVGAYHELNDQWALLGTVGWEDWSAFDKFAVSTPAGAANLPTGWEDTYHFSGGVHYRPNKDWLLQAGLTYDTSPVSSGDRSAYLPMDRQIRLAVGAQYQWNERMKIGAAFEYVDLGDANINNPSLLVGDYDSNHLFVFAINMSYQF